MVGCYCFMVNCILLVMDCIQLDLFSGRVIAPVESACAEYDDAADRQGLQSLFVDPCEGCDLRDFCSDECAKHLYPIDVNKEPKNFSAWLRR